MLFHSQNQFFFYDYMAHSELFSVNQHLNQAHSRRVSANLTPVCGYSGQCLRSASVCVCVCVTDTHTSLCLVHESSFFY